MLDPWLAWLAVSLSGAVHVLAAVTAATFAGAPRWRVRPGNGNGDEEPPPARYARLDGPTIRSAANAVAVGAILGVALALASALGAGVPGAASLAIAGGAAGGGAAILFGLLSAADVGEVRVLRAALLPLALAAQTAGSLPVVRWLNSRRGGALLDALSSHDTVSAVLEQELELLEAAGLSGQTDELRMMRAVLELDTARVREIMRPRVDMVVAQSDDSADEVARSMAARGYSRIPIYGQTIDEIVGVVHAQDLLRTGASGNGAVPRVGDLARQALFVPESQKLEQLLREFQRARTQIAIVVDEYGGVSGLVTVEDLIEEIVGELVDEFDRDEPEVRRISDDEVVLDARMPLDTLRDEFGKEIEADGFDTVGGLVYRELGKMPSVGDSVQVDALRLTVESTIGRRIRRLRVSRAQAPVEEAS